MEIGSKIYVAGHRGLAGSAIVRALRAAGYERLLLRTRDELDLAEREAVGAFFVTERPENVFLAAAKVGGIMGNSNNPVQARRHAPQVAGCLAAARGGLARPGRPARRHRGDLSMVR